MTDDMDTGWTETSERPKDDTGWTETTEEPHRHYCAMCGGTWVHADESCIGPRFRGFSPYDPDFSCPACVDPE